MKLIKILKKIFKKSEKVKIKEQKVEQKVEQKTEHPKNGFSRRFIDLSHHNKNVDCSKMQEETLVFLKATQGTSFKDDKFKERWNSLRINNVRRGAYHFYQCKRDPISQAKHFLSFVGELEDTDVLCLDYETEEGQQGIQDLNKNQSNAIIFMDYIEKNTGIVCWFYTGNHVIKEVKFHDEFKKYPLWIARYTDKTPNDIQLPWTKWTAWQFTELGKSRGVTGNCDVNYLNS